MLSRIDLKVFLPAVLLCLIGSLVISSVSPKSYPSQFIFLGLGLITFLITANLDTRILRTFAPILYIVSLILLVITAVFGALSHGAVRWIDIGPFTLQPSEVAKLALIIFLAWILSRDNSQKRFFLCFLAMLPIAGLVLVQPDLGSTIVVGAGFLGVIFLGGVPWKFLIGGLVGGIVASPIMYEFLAPYQRDRLLTFIQPASDPLGRGYNSIQAKIAVGSGGFTGRGLGQGTQSQLLFLPERHTDFIFASIGEELGFLGVGIIIAAFGVIMWRIIDILKSSDDTFAKALLGGIFFSVFTQAVVNIGMNMGVLPITGIPLPFVSAGGSALLIMCAMLGIVSAFSAELRRR
jgi:rod shape determining protein RodA